MLSKEERKERNEKFWSTFKEVMRKTQSSSGRRINWATYPTQINHFYLRLVCDGKLTAMCLDLQFKDDGVRAIVWEQLGELKMVMESVMTQKGIWLESLETTEGLIINRIQWELPDKNFYTDEDWPEIHAFFKKRLVEFDAFYQEFKDILILLVE
jgi:hypothetical protein